VCFSKTEPKPDWNKKNIVPHIHVRRAACSQQPPELAVLSHVELWFWNLFATLRESKPPPRQLQCLGEEQWHLLWVTEHYIVSCHVWKGSGKVILDKHLDLVTSRGSTLASTYHVWSTSVNTLLSYFAHRQHDRQTAPITWPLPRPR